MERRLPNKYKHTVVDCEFSQHHNVSVLMGNAPIWKSRLRLGRILSSDRWSSCRQDFLERRSLYRAVFTMEAAIPKVSTYRQRSASKTVSKESSDPHQITFEKAQDNRYEISRAYRSHLSENRRKIPCELGRDKGPLHQSSTPKKRRVSGDQSAQSDRTTLTVGAGNVAFTSSLDVKTWILTVSRDATMATSLITYRGFQISSPNWRKLLCNSKACTLQRHFQNLELDRTNSKKTVRKTHSCPTVFRWFFIAMKEVANLVVERNK